MTKTQKETKQTLTKKEIYEQIKKDYKIELTDYQQTGVKFMLEKNNVLNADEMGLGKTFQAIATAILSNAEKTIIIVPSALISTWINDGFKPFGLLKEIQTANNKSKLTNKKFTVVSYNYFRENLGKIKEFNPDLFIFDEVHYLKNDSGRGKAGSIIRKLFPDKKFILLSGTPITNSFDDLMRLFELLKIEIEHLKFLQHLLKQDKRDIPEDVINAIQKQINEKTIRRIKEDVEKLPNKFKRLIYLELKDEDEGEYKKIARNIKKNGFSTKERQYLAKIKINYIKDIIKLLLDKNLKVILFFNFLDTAKEVKKHFQDLKTINGKVTKKKRQKIIKDFKQSDKAELLAMSLKIGGTGYNLTECKDIVFLELDWNPANLKQAEDRIYRKKQKNDVYIYYFVLISKAIATIEETIFNRLKLKDRYFNYIFEENKNAFEIQSTTKDSLIKEIENRFTKDLNTLTKDYISNINPDDFLKSFDEKTKEQSSNNKEDYTEYKKSEEERIYEIIKTKISYEELEHFIKNPVEYLSNSKTVSIPDFTKTMLEEDGQKYKNLEKLTKDYKAKKITSDEYLQQLKENTPLIHDVTIHKTGIFLKVYETAKYEYSYTIPLISNVSISSITQAIKILNDYKRNDLYNNLLAKVKGVFVMYKNDRNQMNLFA